jgi:hypothetical protein
MKISQEHCKNPGPKSTVWFIINKKKTTGEHNYVKRPGRLRKTTVVDDRIILSMVNKPPLTTAQQIKNTLLDTVVDVSKSTICRRLHQQDYRVQYKMQTTDKPEEQKGEITVC